MTIGFTSLSIEASESVVIIDGSKILAPSAQNIHHHTVDDGLVLVLQSCNSIGWEMSSYELETSMLKQLSFTGRRMQYVLRNLAFSRPVVMALDACECSLKIERCRFVSLQLISTGLNTIEFDASTRISALSASITDSLLLGAHISGGTVNTVEARGSSSMQLCIGLENRERLFKFRKDPNSEIHVRCSESGGARSVQQHVELWSLDAHGLSSLLIAPDTTVDRAPAAAPSRNDEDGRPQCSVCKEALPNVLIQPCHHVCLCQACEERMRAHGIMKCPVCRASVEETKPVFISCT